MRDSTRLDSPSGEADLEPLPRRLRPRARAPGELPRHGAGPGRIRRARAAPRDRAVPRRARVGRLERESRRHGLAGGSNPLLHHLVFLGLGVLLGGYIGAFSGGRIRVGLERGPRASVAGRVAGALFGGVLMGVAARLANGCTSGQALTGGASLAAGSWVFMMAVFAGGYALAWFVRRQWT